MKTHSLSLIYVVLLLLLLRPIITYDLASPQSSATIYGRVVDANTGLPISNATILIWDLNLLSQPKPGAGIYFTDGNGEYNASDSYIKDGHSYYVIAYKGDFTTTPVKVDYVPAIVKNVNVGYREKKNVSFSLISGALIELTGAPFIVLSSNPEALRFIIRVIPKEEINVPFVDEYGGSSDAWWLNLKENLVIIPADTPVILETKVLFFSGEAGNLIGSETFFIRNGSSPFRLSQGNIYSSSLSWHSLDWGLKLLRFKTVEISNQIDRARDEGFIVFEERRLLTSTSRDINQIEMLLLNAQNVKDYLEIWTRLRKALGTLNFISATLENKRLISMANAIYLSAVMATFSTTLAFFLFEKEKRKILSNIAIFLAYLILLYFFYPGAHITIKENAMLFLGSATISFVGVTLLVFGIPHVWKERSIEGEVSWRSAVTIIFSMGKRQIKRRKIRGFFTILSITILVLAFTSLTSFGTAFGIVSEEIGGNAPSDGVLVKRMTNRFSLLFSPLGAGTSESLSKMLGTLSKLIGIEKAAPRLKNLPSSSPIIRLVNPREGRNWLIYGILGIEPTNETVYTNLKDTVEGGYLSGSGNNEVLISRSVANALRVRIGDNVTLEVLGAHVSTTFTVVGLIDDEKYVNLLDLDGTPFGPIRLLEDGTVRTCNSTEVLITSLKGAENLQRIVDMQNPYRTSKIFVLSEIAFQPKDKSNIDSIARTLIFIFNYDVFISIERRIIYYHIGPYIEMKGTLELLTPLIMVGLNVGSVMLNSIYERRKEIRTLSMLGLNPTHIGLIFVAEAVVLGMVGGSLGYIFGLGFYRIMILLGQDLMVREKLEWWWSAIGFALAMAVSILSSIRPAILAVSTYTPSKMRKIKRSQKEAQARKEEIFRMYHARELSMPVKVSANEILFFISYCLDRLNDLTSGFMEKVENIEETPEIENVRGELMKTIKFEYIFAVYGKRRRTKNKLILTKSPHEDSYRVKLVSEPAVPGLPESTVERTIDFVHTILMDWTKEKGRIIGSL